ncbi:ATP-grasp ribosomal peptide maturase [Streptomyces genisteinicus]|uniref:ATP-grasp ribosomal peptide maturase n=1 Tax=Streptomyces genisteinicus TaxID=2768068 RepID=A0A7H0HMQ6_9ACTN|nr:ATP-grasp ribosomal peptide maturase [Streptomyces genisteinicus]QNP61822.1 ATP-grasp ribosomal peptide maturase [Streptomyces genisteinicus]
MTVLVLTSEQDVTADMVVAQLHELGVPLVRFDPGDLPGDVALSAEYVRGEFRGYLSTGGRVASVEAMRSVWIRRPGEAAAHAPEPSAWLTDESGHALYGMLDSTAARWMNHPSAAARARRKPWQMRLAHRSGFPVPATLVTTYPAMARKFAEQYRHVVVKSVSGKSPGDPPMALPTTLVPPDADFSGVAAAPTLLQRYIAKSADIRLTSVGCTHLAARKTAEAGQVDGRFGETGHTWEPVDVPAPVARAVERYKKEAELAYGAFDFAEDADGTWWFLECNQGGQFGFVELETGQPIARTVAEWLAAEPTA